MRSTDSVRSPRSPLTRRSRRRADSRRRLLSAAALTTGLAVAAIATTGLAAAPSSAPIAAGLTMVVPGGLASVPAAISAAQSVSTSAADATDTLDRARATLAKADELNAEIATGGVDVGSDSAVDTSGLDDATSRLADADVVPMLIFPQLAQDAADQTQDVSDSVDDLRGRFELAKAQRAAELAAAEAKRKADEAAAAAAAAAAAEAQRAAEELAAANTPDGAKAAARQLAADRYGWGDGQLSCLSSLWQKESGWNYRAYNPSGATGIPQALPGSKMASFGGDWATNARTQIAWGLDYISRAYGTPCAAWGHSQAMNWY